MSRCPPFPPTHLLSCDILCHNMDHWDGRPPPASRHPPLPRPLGEPMTQSINFRMCLLAIFCTVAVVSVLRFPPGGRDSVLALESGEAEVAEETSKLGIDSPAPSLDIEHWIQDGNGFFKPVTDFEQGKVYVVEFWATWCPPCVASMPHLASLQQQYRGKDVQIISVSDEPLETVTEFLQRKTEGDEGQETTFAEVTSAYSLTTDPDGSTHQAYMEASGQGGIPTAFIVGKDSRIEWIGHPMEMDEPLQLVVNDQWDRQEYLEQFKAQEALDQLRQQLSQLVGRGRFAEALEAVEAELAKQPPAEIAEQLQGFRRQVKLLGGMIDQEMAEFVRQQVESNKGNVRGILQLALTLCHAASGEGDQGALRTLIKETIPAVENELATTDGEMLPVVYDTIARMHEACGDLDAAIQAQQSAIEQADPQTARRLESNLQRLVDAKNEAQESDGEDG